VLLLCRFFRKQQRSIRYDKLSFIGDSIFASSGDVVVPINFTPQDTYAVQQVPAPLAAEENPLLNGSLFSALSTDSSLLGGPTDDCQDGDNDDSVFGPVSTSPLAASSTPSAVHMAGITLSVV
jgi:hypothetical protein